MNGCVECVQEQVSHLEQISSDILYLFFPCGLIAKENCEMCLQSKHDEV